MPVIPEDVAVSPDMDEFVNWDNAAPSSDSPAMAIPAEVTENVSGKAHQAAISEHDVEGDGLLGSPFASADREALIFENPNADDFSFWAMEHYTQSNTPEFTDTAMEGSSGRAVADAPANTAPQPVPANELCPPELWDVPQAPCFHCKLGGYQCKTIVEGNYKGYCTSCVALRCECSFGLATSVAVPTEIAFPPNPWPTMGDHPEPAKEDGIGATGRESPSGTANETVSKSSSQQDLQPKLGARFSRESVRILKNWVSTHSRHPYPTEDEKEGLQRLTGLNKTQISNWLANARRRGKIPVTRSTSPHVRNSWTPPTGTTAAIDIPQPRRSGTPSPFDRRPQQHIENIPLQRWANSPPEHEPASVSDIARAITSSSAVSSGLNSPFSLNFTDDGSSRSQFNGSSASSVNTSQSSGGSFASAFSHASRGSFGSSFSSLGRGRRRRRRRSALTGGTASGSVSHDREKQKTGDTPGKGTKGLGDIGIGRKGPTPLQAPLKTYQCTFCTETFKTKHDWQRHEKSLHLSLERWVCTPKGAVVVHPETKLPSCAFCGEAKPDEAHIESHNYAICQERASGDRTFYRKDHLRQHLKLVHGVKFASWSMDAWKAVTPQIRSRCGFCGIVMDTWTFRTDHLADHFKTGRTMAEWKGDWGFEAPVLEMVENSIPPYLIHDERNSPLPYSACKTSPGSPRNAYELLRFEISYWIVYEREIQKNLSDNHILVEACRIFFASEFQNDAHLNSASWLRDLIMSNEDCAHQARISPIRTQADSRMSSLHINGKVNLFDLCPLETALLEFVHSRMMLGLTATDTELQGEACRIISQKESEMVDAIGAAAGSSSAMDNELVDLILRMIRGSTGWLAAFRQRAHLPRSDDIADEARRPLDDPANIDATILNYSRLETELADFVWGCHRDGRSRPDDAELQSKARDIVYGNNDGWNQTAADDAKWLETFKSRHMAGSFRGPCKDSSSGSSGSGFLKPSPFFLNDTNCYRRLARELTRFTTATMSPNNPNQHIPSDEELQHQARWILYDDDDPWNQTAADNAEWLLRFKRDVGIVPDDHGPGLPTDSPSWNISQGGTGFAPPYCYPAMPIGPLASVDQETAASSAASSTPEDPSQFTVLQLPDGDASHGVLYGLAPETANNYLQTFTTRYAKPATVFCSRELEGGLIGFVRDAVLKRGEAFPDDAALRAKGRDILQANPDSVTAADDEKLLQKFKDMMRTQLAADQQFQQQLAQLPLPSVAAATQPAVQPAIPTTPVDVNGAGTGMVLDLEGMNLDLSLDSVSPDQIESILQEMNY